MSTVKCKKLRIGRNMLQSIADRFRQVRLALGFKTQAAFAAHLGIAGKTLWSIENGAQLPGTELLIKLRKAGIDINLMLEGDADVVVEPVLPPKTVREPINSAQSLLLYMMDNNLDPVDLQFFATYYTSDCKTRAALQAFLGEDVLNQQKKG